MHRSLVLLGLMALSAPAADNDRMVLTDGRQFAGQFIGMDHQVVRFAFGSTLQEMPRTQVQALYQAGQQVLPEPPPPPAPAMLRDRTSTNTCAPRGPDRRSGWSTGYGVGFGSQGQRYSSWNYGWNSDWLLRPYAD